MPSKSRSLLFCYSGLGSSATFVLRCCGPESDFVSVNYVDCGFNFVTKITVNIFLTTNRLTDCQEILSVRRVLLVSRNFKERNKKYFQSFLFFTEVPNVKYSDRMVFIKYRQNPCKNLQNKRVYFLSEVADWKHTALPKSYVLHSYFRTILLKVWVIVYCI